MQRLVVIEFNMESDLELCNEDYTPLFMPSSSNSDNDNNNNPSSNTTTNLLPTITSLLSLFQGHNTPKNVSNVLLYFDREKPKVTSHHNNKSNATAADDDDNDDDGVKHVLNFFTTSIYPLLKLFVLTKEKSLH